MAATAHAPLNGPGGVPARPAVAHRPGPCAARAVRPAEGQRPSQAAQPAEPRGAGLGGPPARRRRDPHARLRADGRREHAGQHRRARADPQRHPRRGLRARAARAAAARPDGQRHPRQHLQVRLRRAQRRPHQGADDVPGRPPPAARHRPHRLGGRPPRRRQLADGRRAPGRRQPRQRDHPAAGRRRPAAVDSALSQGTAEGRGPGRPSAR